MAARKREARWDRYGKIVLMAEVDGWVMVRRPHRVPFVMARKDWDVLPDKERGV